MPAELLILVISVRIAVNQNHPQTGPVPAERSIKAISAVIAESHGHKR